MLSLRLRLNPGLVLDMVEALAIPSMDMEASLEDMGVEDSLARDLLMQNHLPNLRQMYLKQNTSMVAIMSPLSILIILPIFLAGDQLKQAHQL